MKQLLKKLAIAGALVTFGFFASSFTNQINTAKATVPTAVDWQIQEVARNGFTVHVVTDPETQIQYIVVYRYNRDEGVALAVTPRLSKQP